MKIIKSLLLIVLLIQVPQHSYSQLDTISTDYEKGVLQDGYKVGIWEYYDQPGELALKVDYNSARLLFLKKDTTTYAIREGGKWIGSRLDIYPRYLGSMHEFYGILAFETQGKYPREARVNSTVGTIHIMFEIDSTGAAGNFETIDDIGDGCAEIVLAALQKVPNFWLSAQKSGRTYASRFILPVTFKIIVDGEELKPTKKQRNSHDLPLAKKLTELVVVAQSAERIRLDELQKMLMDR